jgi:alpha-tubulin suppressor-like RCC1 family protein
MSTPAQLLKKPVCVALAAALVAFGCSDPSGPGDVSIVIDRTELALLPGDTAQLSAVVRASGEVLPSAAIVWSSSNNSIATVTYATGRIRAVAQGEATITAESNGVRATARVTVHAPAPVIDSLSPRHAERGAGAFTLRVRGRDFVPDSRVYWADMERPTTFISATELSAQITADDVVHETSLPVTVRNPEASGGASTAAFFVVGRPFRRTPTTISAGDGYTCAIDDAGLGHCWGSNYGGRLGIAPDGRSAVPTRIATDRHLMDIETSNGLRSRLACALTTDGAALCWGTNTDGQLGRADLTHSTVPVEVSGGHRFVDLAVGENHACAVAVDGAAYCWGYGAEGQLGDGLRRSGPEVTRVPGDHRFVAIVAGERHSCALTDTGRAYCWGDVSRLGIGIGPWSQPGIPPPPEVRGVTPVAGNHVFESLTAAVDQTCGLRPDGEAYCWGGSSSAITFRFGGYAPTRVPGDLRFASLDIGWNLLCGIALNGGAHCWGTNELGQLGDGSTMNRIDPSPVVGSSSFRVVTAGDDHSCAIEADGTVLCWGRAGALGNGRTEVDLTPVPVAGGLLVSAIGAGDRFSCALDDGGNAYCWGTNGRNQLRLGGDAPEQCGLETCSFLPVRVPDAPPFHTLAVGPSHSCAATAAGEAYCWGNNFAGQLGNGSTSPGSGVVAVSGSLRFRELASLANTTCGITFDEHLYCWGSDLPLAGKPSSTVPVLVSEGTFVRLVSGGGHACGLTDEGALYCWGSDAGGQLTGAATETCTYTDKYQSYSWPCTSTPVRVAAEYTFTTVSAGGAHTCGITTGGVSLCWGLNFSYQLGAPSNEGCGDGSACSREPLPIEGGHTFSAIAAGGSFTCALTTAGNAYCWGHLAIGGLASSVPVPMGGPPLSTISAGSNHVCASTEAMAPYCWGAIGVGQVGTGRRTYEVVPVPIPDFRVLLSAPGN